MTGMDEHDLHLAHAAKSTYVVRPPKQALATFGTTSVRYYLVTEPAYAELEVNEAADESVIREGNVRAERPQVVTPSYLSRHEGFGSHAQEYLDHLMREYGPDAPGLMYTYKNEFMETSIVSGTPDEVTRRITARLDREQRPLEAVIRGVDELWDVSLMKFIYDLTSSSVGSNVAELRGKGLLQMDDGIPREARQRIDQLIEQARQGTVDPSVVHRELERWGLFDEYQDRFLGLFA